MDVDTLTVLSLEALWKFQFPQTLLLTLLCDDVLPFLRHPNSKIRRNAVVCCGALLLRDAAILLPSPSSSAPASSPLPSSSHIPPHRGIFSPPVYRQTTQIHTILHKRSRDRGWWSFLDSQVPLQAPKLLRCLADFIHLDKALGAAALRAVWDHRIATPSLHSAFRGPVYILQKPIVSNGDGIPLRRQGARYSLLPSATPSTSARLSALAAVVRQPTTLCDTTTAHQQHHTPQTKLADGMWQEIAVEQ
uniref:Uncharacterized protein n=2 Tax=Lygus hesperus TaxID=30085 RepID=A0A146LSF9_LYGHE